MKSCWVIALAGLFLAVPVKSGAEDPHSEAEVQYLRNLKGQLQAEIEGFKKVEERLQEEIRDLHQQVHVMEGRLSQLEGKTVLSMPELVVKEKKEYVCANGHLYDELPENKRCPIDGGPLSEVITYQKEKAYRRENIEEKIETALEEEASRRVSIGISATGILQQAIHSGGDAKSGHDDLFGAGSADLFVIAKPALYTTLFADMETIGNFSPNSNIPTLSALNGDTTRRYQNSEIHMRELWLASQFFKQTLSLTAGHIDLTNYFDLNLVANDETRQFITDALVNNPLLGVPDNGAGIVGVFDTKKDFKLRLGFQRNHPDQRSIGEKIYSIFEASYLARPRFLQEGNYRFWLRSVGNLNRENVGFGISIDQRLSASMGSFLRYGNSRTKRERKDNQFFSGGFQLKTPYTFYPRDVWSIGIYYTDKNREGDESLAELYYNFYLTEHIKVSPHLQWLFKSEDNDNLLLPGLRVQMDF